MKKFGGVKETARVESQFSVCAGCGRTHEDCAAWWDNELKVTGHAGDTGQKSDYVKNVRNVRQAIAAGRDPYCFQAGLKAMGYVPDWTPHMPPGSFSVPTTIRRKRAKT